MNRAVRGYIRSRGVSRRSLAPLALGLAAAVACPRSLAVPLNDGEFRIPSSAVLGLVAVLLAGPGLARGLSEFEWEPRLRERLRLCRTRHLAALVALSAVVGACRHDWRLNGASLATCANSLSLLGLTLLLTTATRLPWWFAAVPVVAINYVMGMDAKGRAQAWAWLVWQGRPTAQLLCGAATFVLGGVLFVVRPGRVLHPD